MARIVLSLLLFLFLISSVWADQADKEFFAVEEANCRTALQNLQAEFPAVRAYYINGLTTRLYGHAFAFGVSPEDAAEGFKSGHAAVLGADPEDLIPESYLQDKRHTQPLMYNKLYGDYKFTLVYYRQVRDGLPVYGAELRLLVRNEIDYPVVLAASSLRPLGDFRATDFGTARFDMAREIVTGDNPGLTDFIEMENVIWAGINDVKARPRMAVKLVGMNDFPEEWLYIIDAETGDILHKEDLIIFEDVVGSVQGMSTEGLASEQCADEIPMVVPYAQVNISGGSTAYTDGDGNFTISNSGTDDVTVQSYLRGHYFRVYNNSGSDAVLSESVTPPGPADFMHNEANTSEYYRAQVNGYIQANIVRDMALVQNPSYPTVSTQTNFPVYVNRTDGYCPGNAWYSPSLQTINFCTSSGSYPNTAWQSVIHHEYGHHLVNMGGSGQGQYGEGMSDCVAMISVDDPRLGLGFYGSCTQPLRNADNTYQYPCSGGIHDCGQLLSGCVWSTRNELINTYPTSYMDTLAILIINSILLHTGDMITPQITIDWLTLDDDDFNLDNGTPHYPEICTGFNAHNMDCPELSLLWFEYPNGIPDIIGPGVSTVVDVIVHEQSADPVPGSGVMYYSVDGGAFIQGTMNQITGNTYEAVLPPVDCGQTLHWYVGAEAIGYGMVYDPSTAPASYYHPVVATEYIVAFADDFETDQGWTFSGGTWGRGTPTGGGGQYGNPDPSSAYEGENILGYNLYGDYENSIPEYHATSPAIDCSELAGVTFKFYRWLGVEQPIYDHAYIRISNNGSNWTTIWENGETITDNSWLYQEFDISPYADGEATVYIRFTMGTTDGAWRYCGWNIDNLVISAYECDANSPQISTVDLPDWTAGQPYTFQMEAIGGTGGYTWTDKNNDLGGTGLSLSSTGLLSGTPNATGPIDFIAKVTDDSLYSDEELISFYINRAVTIVTDTLPEWTQGILYNEQLIYTGGTGPVSFADKNGDLAGTGLSMTVGGLITGTPVNHGVITFIAQAGDSTGSIDEKTYNININQVVSITTTTVPDANKDEPYSYQLESVGGTGELVWSDKNNDLDGTGLTLSAAGLLSGTPNAEGDFSFTAHLVDELGSGDERPLTVTVLDVLHITSGGTLPPWTVGNTYSQQLEAAGGIGNHTWSDKYGDLTATGLVLSAGGQLTGAPADTGLIAFWAVVEDEVAATDEKRFTLVISPGIVVVTTGLPDWTVGVPYSQQLEATGGTGNLQWHDKNNVLAGTGLTLGTSGSLSGTPTEFRQVDLLARVADQGGDTVETLYSFEINPAVFIEPASLPEVTSGAPYSIQLYASGGTGSLAWADKNSDLDGTGLSLSAAGLLSGVITAEAPVMFVARVDDEVGGFDERSFTITINPPLTITTTAVSDWTVNRPYSYQLEVSGGTGAVSWVDLHNDLDGTGLSLDAAGLLTGTPTGEGPMSFTAEVEDMGEGSDEQLFEFTINPAVSITTETVPGGIVDEPYSVVLECTGGTGELTWNDMSGQLDATGLGLGTDGLLSGIPVSEMSISFTAEVTDIAGSADTRQFNLDINPAFICGDANNDDEVNILDISFIIAYLYQGGAAPDPLERADVNSDGAVNILDATGLIDYLYMGGPEPDCP